MASAPELSVRSRRSSPAGYRQIRVGLRPDPCRPVADGRLTWEHGEMATSWPSMLIQTTRCWRPAARLLVRHDPRVLRPGFTPRAEITHRINVRRFARQKQAAL